jgi:GH35 family endo-1,4-beta-xylanase
LQLGPKPAPANTATASIASEANFLTIPNYQWQFLSASEKAAVNASIGAIMSQRIKNITLNIVDTSGVPYTGKLQVTQTSTEFLNTVDDPIPGYWNDYLALTPSHSQALFARWSIVEATRGVWDFKGPDYNYAVGVEHGLTRFHMHLGPYYSERYNSIPDWAKPLDKSARSNASDYEALKSAMREYVGTVVSHFKGRVQLYELWWEANAYYGNGNWPLDRIIDIIKMEALTIRATDPAARIAVDLVYETPDTLQYLKGSSNWTTEYFVQQLLAASVPFDVIGLETHIGTGSADAAGDVATLYNWLIELAKFGKSLYIWEDGLESYLPPDWVAQQGPPWWVGPWHGTPSEAKQAEYMVAETLVYLGNPSEIGLEWYLLVDESPWFNNLSDAGVLYSNGTRKMSFYALEHLWSSLMVNGTVQSVNGVAALRGLAGDYSISVEGYGVEPSTLHVSEGKQNMFSLVLRSTTSITSTTSGSVTANSTIAAPTPNIIENPVLILAGALCVAVVLVAAMILRRRNPSSQERTHVKAES